MAGEFRPARDVMRLFVAVEISDEVRRSLAAAQSRLRRTPARVGWVAPENIHLTLAFLGDVGADRIASLAAALDGVGREFAPFGYTVAGLGCFGSRRAPRVLWAGVSHGAEDLVRLQAQTAVALRALDVRLEDRPFSPHLTIGRVRSSRGAERLGPLLEAGAGEVFGTVDVARLLLMRSELRPQGPVYTVTHEASFAAVPACPAGACITGGSV
jgi:2'-5' RNA ligase